MSSSSADGTTARAEGGCPKEESSASSNSEPEGVSPTAGGGVRSTDVEPTTSKAAPQSTPHRDPLSVPEGSTCAELKSPKTSSSNRGRPGGGVSAVARLPLNADVWRRVFLYIPWDDAAANLPHVCRSMHGISMEASTWECAWRVFVASGAITAAVARRATDAVSGCCDALEGEVRDAGNDDLRPMGWESLLQGVQERFATQCAQQGGTPSKQQEEGKKTDDDDDGKEEAIVAPYYQTYPSVLQIRRTLYWVARHGWRSLTEECTVGMSRQALRSADPSLPTSQAGAAVNEDLSAFAARDSDNDDDEDEGGDMPSVRREVGDEISFVIRSWRGFEEKSCRRLAERVRRKLLAHWMLLRQRLAMLVLRRVPQPESQSSLCFSNLPPHPIYDFLASNVYLTRVENYYWDDGQPRREEKKATYARLIGINGQSAETRFYFTYTQSSFPRFYSKMFYCPGSYDGVEMVRRFEADPQQQHLFEVGFGRVEVDRRPTIMMNEFARLKLILGLPLLERDFPSQYLWNVVTVATGWDDLGRHEQSLQMLYQLGLREAFQRACMKKQAAEEEEVANRALIVQQTSA